MITTFPLMLLALVAYNIVIFAFPTASWFDPVWSLQMVSGIRWEMLLGDLMIVLGLILLFFEILKATRIGRLSIIDHLLSTVVLILFVVEFLLLPEAATSVFFILMLMALVDVMAGFSVSIRSATRDVSLGDGGSL